MQNTQIKILAFGMVAEALKQDELWIQSAKDTEALLQQLKVQFPMLREIAFSVAINREVKHENTLLTTEEEVALLPPFSGG